MKSDLSDWEEHGEDSDPVTFQDAPWTDHIAGMDYSMTRPLGPLDEDTTPLSQPSNSDTGVFDREMDIDNDASTDGEDEDSDHADDRDEEDDKDTDNVDDEGDDDNTDKADDNDDSDNDDITFLWDGTDWKTLPRCELSETRLGMHDLNRLMALPYRYATTVRGVKSVRRAVRDFICQRSTSTEGGIHPPPVEQDDVILLHLVMYGGLYDPSSWEIYPEHIEPFIGEDDYKDRFLEVSQMLVKVIDENADARTHLRFDEKTRTRLVKLSTGTWFQLPAYNGDYWWILETVGQNAVDFPIPLVK